MSDKSWQDLGDIENFKKSPLTEVEVGGKPVVIVFADGTFSAFAGATGPSERGDAVLANLSENRS